MKLRMLKGANALFGTMALAFSAALIGVFLESKDREFLVVTIISIIGINAVMLGFATIFSEYSGRRKIENEFVVAYSGFGKEICRVNTKIEVYVAELEYRGFYMVGISNSVIEFENWNPMFGNNNPKTTIYVDENVFKTQIEPILEKEVMVFMISSKNRPSNLRM